MHKCEIIKEEKDIFEVTNGTVRFTFYKIGENQGSYDVSFDHDKSLLKNCYASVNTFSPDSKLLLEISSLEYCFENDVKEINDKIGSGFQISFSALCSTNQRISFKLQFKLYDEKDFILIKLIDLIDGNNNPLSIHSISPLTMRNQKLWLNGMEKSTNLTNISWFKNGWQSWSPNYTLFGKERDKRIVPIKMMQRVLDNQDYEIKGRFYSEYCTVITDLESQNSLILGFTTLKDQFSRIVLDYKNAQIIKLLTAFGCLDGITLPNSSINSSEELFITFKTNNCGYYGLIDYAKIINIYKEERILDVPIGWCSWYYYYTKISEKDMVKNFEFFKEHTETLPIDFIQLDDGYQAAIGDYNIINDKFPKGLDWLFSEIKSSGFKTGIWTGPFFAVKDSKLFQAHPEWFLKKQGTDKLIKATFNWGAFLHGLNLSIPAVIEYLKDFFNKMHYALKETQEEPLIDFFKIDFLHAAVPYDGIYNNKNLTRAQLYYNGVKAVREGIGEDSFLLGCGAPLGPCIGLVDAMRIGTDTAPNWKAIDKLGEKRGFSVPSLKRALLPVLYRSFMHKYLWINDPDCLMIRRNNTKLNYDEIKLQITIFGLSGGQLLISDDMSLLSDEEIYDAKLVIPPYNPDEYDPIPTDILYSKYPSIYMLETFEDIGKRYLTAIINWEDKSINRSIKISECIPNIPEDEELFLIWNFWEKKYIGEFSRNFQIALGTIIPHSCQYLAIIPITFEMKNEPIFLSSDLHITQGCHEITEFEFDEEKNTLLIVIDLIGKRSGNIYIGLPDDKSILEYNGKFSQIDKNNNIWEIGIDFIDSISIDLKLS